MGFVVKGNLSALPGRGSVTLSSELSYLPIPRGRGREWGGEGRALCPGAMHSPRDIALRVLEPWRGAERIRGLEAGLRT